MSMIYTSGNDNERRRSTQLLGRRDERGPTSRYLAIRRSGVFHDDSLGALFQTPGTRDELNSLVQTNSRNATFQLHRRWQPEENRERILCLVCMCHRRCCQFWFSHFKAICEARKHFESTTRKPFERASDLNDEISAPADIYRTFKFPWISLSASRSQI